MAATRDFAIRRPRSVDETIALLAAAVSGSGSDADPDEARLLAGGQSLIPLLSLGFVHPSLVISLDRCEGLDSIKFGDDTLRLGAMVTTRRAELHPEIARRCPLLAAAAAEVGSPHVRNLGTVVGNLCHADPGSDLVTVARCSGAELKLVSVRGCRWMPVADFVEGPFTTLLQPDEMAESVRIPLAPRGGPACHHGYRKLRRRSGDLAQATAAVMLSIEQDTVRQDTIREVRIAVGGAIRKAARVERLEAALLGATLSSAVEIALGTNWVDELAADLLPDITAPIEYLTTMLPRFLAATVGDAVAAASKAASSGANRE